MPYIDKSPILQVCLSTNEADFIRGLAAARVRRLQKEIEKQPFRPPPGRRDAREVKIEILQTAISRITTALAQLEEQSQCH
jgi:hypothetical protein